ncbi:MAG: LPS export ABC transporter permease LptF [Rhodobacteraceae bacterium]|nr:LPS export ABC transporter permease LptF [Paracoccaceae bacterium]
MAKLDRYILSQLMGPFAIFALTLIGIYWVGRAIGLFDQLIGDGQSVGVFLEIMILFLPQVVAIVLPVVSFAAAIFVANRLHSESEMVVIQAAGVSPMRLLWPFALFGLMVAMLAGALSHYLVPASQIRLEQRQQELSQDMATRLIVGGRFLHPSENVTFFVRDVLDDGSLEDIFLHDQRPQGRDITYTADKAILFRRADDARLVMFDGLIQTFDKENQLLTKIQFDEFVFDIATLTGAHEGMVRRVHEYSTLAALYPTEAMLRATGATKAEFKLMAHKRLEQPLQSLVYPMIGFAVLLLGSFSRFGVLRQILAAVALVVLLSTLSVPLRDMMQRNIALWWLIYVPDVLGLLAVWLMLGQRGFNRVRRRGSRPGGAVVA